MLAIPSDRDEPDDPRPGAHNQRVFRMAVGHSDDIDPVEAAREIIRQCRDGLAGERPRAGLLFSTYDTELAPLVAAIRTEFPDMELAGTTSAGEMSSVLGFQEDSATLAVFASDSVDMTTGLGPGISESPAAAAAAALDQALAATEQPPRLCIALPSVTGPDPTEVLGELQALMGDIPVIGGGSAPNTNPGEPRIARQIRGDGVEEDAVVVLVFSGPLSVSFGVDTGWRPIGARGRVTESNGNVISAIDGEPALAFHERYLGPGGKPTPANPLAVFDGDTPEFYLRVPRDFDAAEGTLLTAGGVPDGAQVQLTVAATDEIFAGTTSAVRKALAAFPGASAPDAALVFSCAIRKLMLGTRTGAELEIARTELGEAVPICGFYCFGEIAPMGSGDVRFHNETMVAVLMGELAAAPAPAG